MSFAQGFAAGSAAAQRGVDMGLAMKQRREEEEYKKAVADYNAGISQQEAGLATYQADMQAAVPVQQGAVAQGPITSAAGLNPLAQAGIAAPAGPDAARTVTNMPTAPSGLGNQARGASFAPPPTVTSYVDQQRDLANIALQYGDTSTALNLMNQAGIEERALRREQVDADQFEQTQGLAVRAQDLADLQYSDQQAEALRVRTFEEGQRQATRDLLLMVDQGKPMSDIQQFIAGNEFLDGSTAMTTVVNAFNLQEAEIQAEQNRIRNDVADMTWEELRQAHIDDENISKGEHYDIVFNSESGLYDVIVFDTTNVIGETESGEKTYAQKRVLGSTEDFGAAVNDLRTLAFDRTTAVESLTNKAVDRRSRDAAAAVRQAEANLKKLEISTELQETVLTQLAGLEKDPMFRDAPPQRKEEIIGNLLENSGVAYTSTFQDPPTKGGEGDGDGDGDGDDGNVDGGLAKLRGLRETERETAATEATEKARVNSTAKEILKTATSMQELQEALTESSPAVQARVNELIEARSSQNRGLLAQYQPYYMRGQ